MRERWELAGWLLFLFSSFGFLIDSALSRNWWALSASALFLLGVVAFLVPMLGPGRVAARQGAEPLDVLDPFVDPLASVGERQPGLGPLDDAAFDVDDVPEPQL